MEIPHIHPDTIEAVQQEVDIVDVISEYVVLRKRGKDYLGLCPFHNEKSPSFSVSQEKQVYYCFGCGAGGNTFKFMMEIGKQSFAEVVLDLARKYQIPVKTLEPEKRQEIQRQLTLREQLYEVLAVTANFYQHALQQSQGKPTLEYLQQERKLENKTISQFQLGYAPGGWETLYRYLVEQKRYPVSLLESCGLIKQRSTGNGYYDVFRDRVTIPILDIRGRVIGFGSRTLGDDRPKYLNSPETPLFDKSRTLFNLDKAHKSIATEDRAIVVEGYFDAIALYTAGITNGVAALGTALTSHQIKQLLRYTPSKQIILNFDGDNAGIKATERAISEVKDLVYSGQVQLRILNLESGKDADEFLLSRDDAVDIYRNALDNAPLWIDWQINNLISGKNLKAADQMQQVATGMVSLLNRLQDANQRNYYLNHCAEILSQGDARLVAQNLANLQSQLSPLYRKNFKPRKTKKQAHNSKSQRTGRASGELSSTFFKEDAMGTHDAPTVRSLGSPISGGADLSGSPTSSNAPSVRVATNPETQLLAEAESLLLLIYIHCPRYRENLLEKLEEKDLCFSLAEHRFLWQQIIEIETKNPERIKLEQDFLLSSLHNNIAKYPDYNSQIMPFLHLEEKTESDIFRAAARINNAIASLELVNCIKYKIYCTEQWGKLNPLTDSEKMSQLYQEIQTTKKRIEELEKMRIAYSQDLIFENL
ncbi:MAG: DNA primase [Xenococcaceae cyanobacterium MO_167.B52]|nr:DNA primase [Xenococcaceae cyanobacterium MO_167.B52]